MATVTLNVSGCSTNACVVSNNGNTTANVLDYVQWNNTGGNTLTINSITPNLGSDTSIWGDTPPAPYPNANSRNWRGQVQAYGDGGENYTISCTCSSNTVSHDPRISVNPINKEDAV